MPDQRLPSGLKSPYLLSAITRSGNHKGAGDGFIQVLNNCPFCIFIRVQFLRFDDFKLCIAELILVQLILHFGWLYAVTAFQSKAGTQLWINEELKSHFFEAASAEVG
ncbi:hypothetical protein RHGRI_037423 [Rhododendron griersonianum]|uniref:Uncharacterized protein n=1 Tax=Rhododendron griersonianum TaxID=479676 RepID=A0AAV6HSQ0_9ERIC|nr:hypothetical protein RHGRI_037423 [Rhododendron griersonianum]